MKNLGVKNGRQLIYLHVHQNEWKKNLPASSWVAAIVMDSRERALIEDVVNTCLDNRVAYICTMGKACEYLHDFFDESIVMKRIDNGLSVEQESDFEREPMTTWHHDFEDGTWFAIYLAFDDWVDIDKVVFLDMTDNGEWERLKETLEKV